MAEDAPRPSTEDRIPRWIVRGILVFFAVQVLWFYSQGILSSLRPFFVILTISAFLSFAIEPLVNRLERMGLRRGIGTGLVFLLLTAAIAGFGFAVGTALAEQINDFVNSAPDTIESVEGWLQDNVSESFDLTDVQDQFLTEDGLGSQLTGIAGDLVGFGSTLLSVLLQVFTVALFTFYLAADGPRIRRKVCSMFPPHRQREILRAWDLATAKTGGYILSRGILAVFSWLAHWVAFEFLNVPSPLALALWVGVISQFVPVVGTYIAGSVPLLVAVADRPITALWVLVFIIVYQQVENYLLAPRIQSQTMEIHAGVAFGAVIAGGYILGPVGALLAVPAAATVQAFAGSYLQRYALVEEAPRPADELGEIVTTPPRPDDD